MEVTGEDSLAASTCAETAAGAVTGDGTVSTGVTGTAQDGRGRTSDQAINQFLLIFDVITFHYFAVNHISVILRLFLCFFFGPDEDFWGMLVRRKINRKNNSNPFCLITEHGKL